MREGQQNIAAVIESRMQRTFSSGWGTQLLFSFFAIRLLQVVLPPAAAKPVDNLAVLNDRRRRLVIAAEEVFAHQIAPAGHDDSMMSESAPIRSNVGAEVSYLPLLLTGPTSRL